MIIITLCQKAGLPRPNFDERGSEFRIYRREKLLLILYNLTIGFWTNRNFMVSFYL